MPKYSKRESKVWTLSSTALGWSLTGIAIALVAFFGLGVYFGYGWGFKQGKKTASSEKGTISSEQLAKLTEGDTEMEVQETEKPELEEEISSEQKEEAAISEEEVDFLNDQETETSPEETKSEGEESMAPEQKKTVETGEQETAEKAGSAEPEAEEETEAAAEQEGVLPMSAEEETAKPEEKPETSPAMPEDTAERKVVYVIQASSSEKKESAVNYAENLETKGYPTALTEANIEGDTWYRVRVGEFPTKADAREFADDMVDKGDIDEGYWVSSVKQ